MASHEPRGSPPRTRSTKYMTLPKSEPLSQQRACRPGQGHCGLASASFSSSTVGPRLAARSIRQLNKTTAPQTHRVHESMAVRNLHDGQSQKLQPAQHPLKRLTHRLNIRPCMRRVEKKPSPTACTAPPPATPPTAHPCRADPSPHPRGRTAEATRPG